MVKKPTIEVGPRPDGWARQRQGTSRCGSQHKAQHEALDAARAQARFERSELIIKGEDGRIRERDRYGNDPRRTKG